MSLSNKDLFFHLASVAVYLVLYIFTDLSKGILFGSFIAWYMIVPRVLKIKPLLESKYQYLIGIAFMIFTVVYIVTSGING